MINECGVMKYDGREAGEKLKEAVSILSGLDEKVQEVFGAGETYDQIGDFEAAAFVFTSPLSNKKIAYSYTWEFLVENDVDSIVCEILKQIDESKNSGDLPM